MKIKNSFGIVKEDTVIDLTQYIDGVTDLREAIRKDKLNELSEMASLTETGISLEEVQYLPTITNPEKIICIGVNYLDRNAEYKDDSELPKYPSVFMRTRESLVGHKEDILDPPESSQLDYEGEIVLIVGKDGRRIPTEQAKKHIAGMTIMNEGSIRDYLRHAKFNVTQGKNFAKSGSIGPWMVTSDELDPFSSLEIKTKVNGELRQNDNTNNLIFIRIPSELSINFYHLKAGDITATGTPNGMERVLIPKISYCR